MPRAEVIIPAVHTPPREGLELSVSCRDGTTKALTLSTGAGVAILELDQPEAEFIFKYGKARIRPSSGPAGRAFVDAVANWLGRELDAATVAESPAEKSRRLERSSAAPECSWAELGAGVDAFGTHWRGFKLFLTLESHHAEVFLRLSDDQRRAQLLEKWSEYRSDLVEILERVLSDLPPRSQRLLRPAEPATERVAFSERGALEFEIPNGFRLTHRPEGHWRLGDAEEEMMIELSALRLPPLPADTPSVTERLRALMTKCSHAETAVPVTSFERGDVAFAWYEYCFESLDNKRPEKPAQPARGRSLIASNVWTQVLVTGCYWPSDAGTFVRAWDEVIASLRVAGRIDPLPEPRGRA